MEDNSLSSSSDSSSRIKQLLAHLNPPQREAVQHKSGPLVVFAGAGSGKTRVITTRIALLIEQGVAPYSILAVTFTNKAAKEMKERVSSLSRQGSRIHLGTFHSMCARWLREFGSHLGFTADFSIYNDKDSSNLLKEILKSVFGASANKTTLYEYKNAINKAKTNGWLPVDVAYSHVEQAQQFFPAEGLLVYSKYQEQLTNCNAMDFNDLLLNMVKLLNINNEVKERLQRRYRHILIDEYQDTNPAQHRLVSNIITKPYNICVVGDDDQSIYGWRGADPSNILNFSQQYSNVKTIRLEQSYRCSGTIIAAANAIIGKNMQRASKELWTENSAGEAIDFHVENDNEGEAYWVADQINRELARFCRDDVAVFYRTNAQSRQLEECFNREGIPYRIYGAVRFYNRTEVKDLVAYMKITVNTDDDISLLRIINTPTRGIGKSTIDKIRQHSSSKNISLYAALKQIVSEASKPHAKLKSFIELINNITEYSKNNSIADLFKYLVERIDYLSYLEKRYPQQMQEKQGNVHELGTAISNDTNNLSHWLQNISLSESESSEEDGVSLMTLHAAKGLEFPRVYIVGMEQGILPHANSLEDYNQLEEERRLFYVGITRTKQKLSLACARKRQAYKQWVRHDVSEFIADIPTSLIATKLKSFVSSELGNKTLCEGGKVYHKTYGYGDVKVITRDFGSEVATVMFKDFGLKRVNSGFLTQINS